MSAFPETINTIRAFLAMFHQIVAVNGDFDLSPERQQEDAEDHAADFANAVSQTLEALGISEPDEPDTEWHESVAALYEALEEDGWTLPNTEAE